MNRTRRYSPEVRERAVRLVFAHEREHPSQWGVWWRGRGVSYLTGPGSAKNRGTPV